MKLIAQILNKEIEIDLKRNESGLLAVVDGREYELEASEPESNVFLLKHENQIFEVLVTPDDGDAGHFQAKVSGEDFEIHVIDPKRLRGTNSQANIADGILELKTAMPGKVVKVLVEEGATVSQGTGIIIVEAMKMQNEMKSTKNGLVKEIRFGEGATVNAGDVLAVIE